MVVKIMVPFWVPTNTGCRIILRTQKGTIILTTTHISLGQVPGSFEHESRPRAPTDLLAAVLLRLMGLRKYFKGSFKVKGV